VKIPTRPVLTRIAELVIVARHDNIERGDRRRMHDRRTVGFDGNAASEKIAGRNPPADAK
jgi:hypothetical protein